MQCIDHLDSQPQQRVDRQRLIFHKPVERFALSGYCVRRFSNPDIRDKPRDSPFLKTRPTSNAKAQKSTSPPLPCSRVDRQAPAYEALACHSAGACDHASIQLREIQFTAVYVKAAS